MSEEQFWGDEQLWITKKQLSALEQASADMILKGYTLGHEARDKIRNEILAQKLSAQRLKEATEILYEVRDIFSFDQWPEQEAILQMMELYPRVAKFLGGDSEWMKSWKRMMEAQVKASRQKRAEDYLNDKASFEAQPVKDK